MNFSSFNSDFSPFAKPVLKVIGLGGGGCNAVNRMIELGMKGIDFIAANTDYQALKNSLAPVKIQLGPSVTRGLGAGGRPEIGQSAAEESVRELSEALKGADIVFLTAGMGGGSGTGSIPVAAKIARELGAVTVAVVTTPFNFEMGRRQSNASAGLAKLRPFTNTMIAIPNDRLLYVAPRDLPMEMAFRLADDVLRQAVQGITELITEPGLINVDFAHIRRLMTMGGGALMSIGHGQGEGKVRQAIEQALHHPLLDAVMVDDAAGIIANFTGGDDMSLYEVNDVLTQLQAQTGSRSEIVIGINQDERMRGRTQVILIVTGLGGQSIDEVFPGTSQRLTATRPAVPAVTMEEQPVEAIPVAAANSGSVNYDIPAFLRRRVKLNN